MQNNILHIIIPFFCYTNSINRINNLERCINQFYNYKNINIVIVEGVLQKTKSKIKNKDFLNLPFVSHVKIELSSPIWVKENLINIGINKLPNDWEYCAWIDSDIIFLNNNFVQEALIALKQKDIIQLFTTVTNLDNVNNPYFERNLEYHNSYIIQGIICSNLNKDVYIYGAPGFAWAINKNFYKKISKLFEYNIIGGGDYIISLCCLKNFKFINQQIYSSLEYEKCIQNYLELFKAHDFQTGYINGLICHLWHGKLENRKYHERFEILKKYNYDPYLHLEKQNGVIQIKSQFKELENEILKYFYERRD